MSSVGVIVVEDISASEGEDCDAGVGSHALGTQESGIANDDDFRSMVSSMAAEQTVTTCWDCQKGQYKAHKRSAVQCRKVHGYDVPNWRQDPRELAAIKESEELSTESSKERDPSCGHKSRCWDCARGASHLSFVSCRVKKGHRGPDWRDDPREKQHQQSNSDSMAAQNTKVDRWVQCEQCRKWRRISKGKLTADDSFECDMLAGMDCDTPDESREQHPKKPMKRPKLSATPRLEEGSPPPAKSSSQLDTWTSEQVKALLLDLGPTFLDAAKIVEEYDVCGEDLQEYLREEREERNPLYLPTAKKGLGLVEIQVRKLRRALGRHAEGPSCTGGKG